MALIGDTNFNMKPDVNMAAIASLYQKKATDEQQMKLQQSQIESQQQDRVMNVMKMATDMTQGIIQSSARNSMLAGRQEVQTLMGQAENPAPTGQMTPAGSSLFPGMTQASTGDMFGNTDQYKQQLKQATLKAAPTAAYDALARQQFIPQAGKNEEIKQMMNPDGTVGYVRVNKATGETAPVTGVTAPQGMNAQVNLTDNDRSNSVLNNMAKAIREGRALPGGLASLRTTNGQKAAALALEQDPNTDLSLFPQRQALRKEFTSGTSAKNLTSLNTVIGHIDTLEAAADSLDNSKLRKYNSVANYTKNEIGKPEVVKFNAARSAVINELGRVFTGVGQITDKEKQDFKDEISAANSPEQIKQTSETFIDLLKSRTDALKANWDQTMSGVKPPTPFLNDKSKKLLSKRGYDPVTMEKTDAGKPSLDSIFGGGL